MLQSQGIAYSVLPTRFEDDRHGAIERCARANGYTIIHGFPNERKGIRITPDDILLTWTIFRGQKESWAKHFTSKGGRVVVCEEAYFRVVNGTKNFALAIGEHSGGGYWNVCDDGPTTRWDSFNIELASWRDPKSDSHILVSEQRSIGSSVMGSPPGWHDRATDLLRKVTNRPIVVRWHPRTRLNKPLAARQPTEEAQLEGCHAVVTWNSALAVHALARGIPVFYQAPHFILEGACKNNLSEIEDPLMDDSLRRKAFERLAWAQWSRAEIEDGTAFRYLLRRPE